MESSEHVKKDNIPRYMQYKCSICNLDVPIMYHTEHNNSPRHKLSIEIADIVLDRVKSNVSAVNVQAKIENKARKTIFCEVCAVAIFKEEVKEHLTSQLHNKSLLHNKLMRVFTLIYVGENCSIKYKNDSGNKDQISEIVNVSGTNSIESDAIKTGLKEDEVIVEYLVLLSTKCEEVTTGVSPSLMEDISEILDDVDGIITKYEEINKIESKKISPLYDRRLLSNYEFLIQNVGHPYTLRVHGFRYMSVVFHFKGTLNISFNHFNGLHWTQSSMKLTQCRVCRMMISGNKYEHIFDGKHLARVRIPFEDEHCCRQIDEKHKHCAICNVIFFIPEDHRSTASHQDAMKKASFSTLEEMEAMDNLSINDQTELLGSILERYDYGVPIQNLPDYSVKGRYCDMCRKYVPRSSYSEHLLGKKHANEVKNAPLIKQYLQQINITRTKAMCGVCHTRLGNGFKKLYDHFTGKLHRQMYKNLLTQNGFTELGHDYLCMPCKVALSYPEVADHIKMDEHKRSLNSTSSKSFRDLNTRPLLKAE